MQIKQSTIIWTLIFGALFTFIYMVGDILMPFIFGIIVAYFLDPLADKLEERGLGRTAATSIVLGVFSTVVIAVVVIFGPLFIEQVSALLYKIPTYVAHVQQDYGEKVKGLMMQFFPDFKSQAQDIAMKFSNEILRVSGRLLTGVLSSGANLFGLLSLVLISPIIAFYMLRDWDVLVKKVDDLLPRERLSGLRKNFKNIDRIISAYIRGQVTVCLIMMALYSILLTMAGLNYSLAIGCVTGILTFVPYVGMLIGAVSCLLVGYFQFEFTPDLLWVMIAFFLGNLSEGSIITPKLVGDKVELHPAWIIFALLAGATILGFTGVLIAIPAAAVIGVLARSSAEAYKVSELYLGFNNVQLGAYNQDGVVTEKQETPIFDGFKDLKEQKKPEEKIILKASHAKPKVQVKTAAPKKPKKKKKEPELKFPKPESL